jgi:F0F1-type ATP synthase assembly protein I
MPTDPDVSAIAHVIQSALAPVFLLTGVSAMLGVLSTRLGRIVDRARQLEARLETAPADRQESLHRQIAVLARRAHLEGRAISLCTICALLICAVVIALFLGAFFRRDVSNVIGGLFIAALIALGAGLLTFLREIHLATRTLRIGPH